MARPRSTVAPAAAPSARPPATRAASPPASKAGLPRQKGVPPERKANPQTQRAGPSKQKTDFAKVPPTQAHDALDTSFLEGLIGYNARRASLAIANLFYDRMAPYGLKQADFSVLILIADNPGATSRQLCATLDILPPNFVRLIGALDRRGLIERRPHPEDGRAVGLYLTAAGQALAAETAAVVRELETHVVAAFSEREVETLRKLLRLLYPDN